MCSASNLAGFTLGQFGARLIDERVELPGSIIRLDLPVPELVLEFMKPVPESREIFAR